MRERASGAASGAKRDRATTSRIMSAVRSKNTKPELRLRRALFALGFRYRVHYRRVIGCPDLAFTKRKVAVFVDGDFWHGHSWKARGFKSLEDQFRHWNNPDFWISKVSRNIERDLEVCTALTSDGWKVIRIRESELDRSFEKCLKRVVKQIASER